MTTILRVVGWGALAGTILPSVLYLFDRMTLDSANRVLLAATAVWFVTATWRHRLLAQG